MVTLGLILLAVGWMGRLSKVKNHMDGFNISAVLGFITLLASFLYYWIGYWWY